jgi:hypothetical protein
MKDVASHGKVRRLLIRAILARIGKGFQGHPFSYIWTYLIHLSLVNQKETVDHSI